MKGEVYMTTMIQLRNSAYRISRLYFNQLGIQYSNSKEEKKPLIVNCDHIRFIHDCSDQNDYELSLTIDGTTGFVVDVKYDNKEAYEHDLAVFIGTGNIE